MSDESSYILQVVSDELHKQSADIVGRVELHGDTLFAHNGNLLLQAEVRNDPGYHPSIAHCHFIARIGGTRAGDPLDACVSGIDADRRQGLTKAAQNWVTNVSCTLFSLLHAKPVMDAAHFDGNDPWGVPGCHGFIGPLYGYGVKKPSDLATMANAGLFDYAAAMAPPDIVHLAKVVLICNGKQGWTRNLEIDGHLANFEERQWNCPIPAVAAGMAGQFAMFHVADQKGAVESRQRLDDTIRQFVSTVGTTKDLVAAPKLLSNNGFDPDIVQQVAAFAPLAFFRVMFADIGASFSPDYQRVKKDGTVQAGKLMREPAFARAVALCRELVAAGHVDAVRALASSSSSFNALNAALNAGSKPEDVILFTHAIPDPDVDAATMERVLSRLQASAGPSASQTPRSRPWWRFW